MTSCVEKPTEPIQELSSDFATLDSLILLYPDNDDYKRSRQELQITLDKY